jgi:hypothetical protein
VRRLTLTVLLALLLCAPFAAPGSAARRVPAGFVGINWNPPSASFPPPLDAQFARMASAGAETVRADFTWASAQPTAGAAFDFGASDSVVGTAAAHHLSVLPVVLDAPAWARDSSSPHGPPRDPSQYAAYLDALVHRYGPNGSFWVEHPALPRLVIRSWQIWNEPDLSFWWPTTDSDWVPSYLALLKSAHAAIKNADRGAKVVLGALTNYSWKDIDALYRAGGRPYFDVAALDPYTGAARGVLEIIRRVRVEMKRFGDGRKPLYVTELGLPASQGRLSQPAGLTTSDAGMARFLSLSYKYLAGYQKRFRIQRAYWFTWVTRYASTWDTWDYAGLFAWDGAGGTSARPAYRTLVRVARRLDGCVKTTSGKCVRRRKRHR